MLALLLFLFYGGILWLALMGLGYLRPRWLDASVAPRANDVDLRSPHAILDAGLEGPDQQPVELQPGARDRVYRTAMAIAARKPHLLFAIGHVIAVLEPTTPEEVDAAIEATVSSVEGQAIDPGAAKTGAWHPIHVRAFLESLPGPKRLYFYLPGSWDGPWHFLAYDNPRQRRRPKATDLSLSLISIDPAAFEPAKPATEGRDREVQARIEGREFAVDRIVLQVEGDAAQAVALRDRLATVAAGFAAGLFAEPLPDGVIHAIRRGHEIDHALLTADLGYSHRIDHPYRTEGDRCLALVRFTRSGAAT